MTYLQQKNGNKRGDEFRTQKLCNWDENQEFITPYYFYKQKPKFLIILSNSSQVFTMFTYITPHNICIWLLL